MFASIRKHQNWIWYVVVVVIIISFVVFFSPDAQFSGAGSSLTVDGEKITARDFREAQAEVRLLYFLNFQTWPEKDERARQFGFELERETYGRILRLAKVREAGIEVSDDTIAALAHRLLGDFPLDRFAQNVLIPAGLTVRDFERFVEHDAAIQQLGAVAGLAGSLVTPAEAEKLFRREHDAVSAQVVLFNVSNYLGQISVPEPALAEWFTNRLAVFRTPEKVLVSYVAFPMTNYLADARKRFTEITNLNLELEKVYLQQGTNAFTDTNGHPLPKAAALEKIKTDEQDRLAKALAHRAANDFASELYDKEPRRAENLNALAAARGFQAKTTEAFDAETGPTNLHAGPAFARAALSLTAEEPISFQPLDGEDAAYVIALKETIPSQTPTFASVREKVVQDFKHSQALQQMRQVASMFGNQVTNGLAQGKSFADLARAANLNPLALPPISPATESLTNIEQRVNFRQLKSVVTGMEPGQVSPFLPSPPDGGFIAYAVKRDPVDATTLSQELPLFTAQLRQQRQNELFGQWFRRQAEKAGPPFVQTRTASGAPAGGADDGF